MLKIASSLIKNYINPINKRKVELDDETLETLFKLITLKIDKETVNQICSLFHSIALIKPECIFENFKKCFIATIPSVKEQLFAEVEGKLKVNILEVVESQSEDKRMEEQKHGGTEGNSNNYFRAYNPNCHKAKNQKCR